MGASRTCEYCGRLFAPRREHERFCSAECRAAWNSGHVAESGAEARALEWSALGMDQAAGRLRESRELDERHAFALVGEAVWWVTIVDARLVRHYTDAYDDALTALPPAGRRHVEGTLSGLRFVRNRLAADTGDADFVGPGPANLASGDGLAGWVWQPVPLLLTRTGSRAWDVSRFRAYEHWLVGRTVWEVFGQVVGFLGTVLAEAGLAPGQETNDQVAGDAPSMLPR